MPTTTARIAVALAASVPMVGVFAAGGHHAVDDAAILDPGQCQVETWIERARSTDRRLLHAGPGCRVGPVELGLNLDHAEHREGTTVTAYGPQVKWATTLVERVSAGVLWFAAWQDTAPRRIGHAVVVPLTWQPNAMLAVHLNVGRDFRAHATDTTRSGIAGEWSPHAAWSFVGERFHDNGRDFWRVGVRWAPSAALSVDLSHARPLGERVSAWWTLGLNWVFAR